MKTGKSDDQFLTTFTPGKPKKVKQAVFIKYVANLENSLLLEKV